MTPVCSGYLNSKRCFWPQNLEVNIRFNVDEKKDGRAMQTSASSYVQKTIAVFMQRHTQLNLFNIRNLTDCQICLSKPYLQFQVCYKFKN